MSWYIVDFKGNKTNGALEEMKKKRNINDNFEERCQEHEQWPAYNLQGAC
jgi:hypothetical protein